MLCNIWDVGQGMLEIVKANVFAGIDGPKSLEFVQGISEISVRLKKLENHSECESSKEG